MGEVLDLNQSIMDFADMHWVLGDIMVYIHLNANGHVATWDVSGPTPVIDEYLRRMNDFSHKSESGIYDYGTKAIKVEPSCIGSAEE